MSSLEGGERVKNEPGTAVYDQELRLEAYRFRRSFPKHFHEYYVIGYIEDGQGALICKDVEYALKAGDIVIYNPGDAHSCAESGAALDYRGLHIPKETMLDLTGELTGQRALPVFSRNVVYDPEAAWDFRALHQQIMSGSREFDREERLLLLRSRRRERGGGAGLRLYGGTLWGPDHLGAHRRGGGTEQVGAAAGLRPGKGSHALQLSGEPAGRRGKKAAGAGRPACRGGPADRLFRPEPLYQLLQPVYRLVPGGVPGNFFRQGEDIR